MTRPARPGTPGTPRMTAPGDDHGLLATTATCPACGSSAAPMLAQHQWMAPGLRGLAKGQRSMASWDEDSVTMAVEAGRQLLQALPGCVPATLTLASTTLPFADRLNAGIVAAALGLPERAATRDVASSPRAAAERTGRRAAPAGGHGAQLLLAAERRMARPASTQEMIFGDGAAGALVGRGAALATHVASPTRACRPGRPLPRAGSEHDYGWEERWVRDEGYLKIAVDTLRQCLADAGVAAADVAHFVMPAPLSQASTTRWPGSWACRPPRCWTPATKAAATSAARSPWPCSMWRCAARRTALILVAAFGSGCDALLLRRSDRPCPGGVPDGWQGRDQLPQVPVVHRPDRARMGHARRDGQQDRAHRRLARARRMAARFEGGRCSACGTVQFPRTGVCVNPDCRAQGTQQVLSLADVPARVLSHTSDFLAYTPHPPFQFGHVDFEGGGRVLMEFADTDAGELTVGLPLRMVYRVKEFDRNRGFRRYFWKATPVRGAVEGN
jgi:hydroxymethylglutaryl-CoA synthase